MNVLLARPSVGYGFSGVVMAFLGYLPLALFWHLEASFGARFDLGQSPVLYFAGLGVIAAWAVPTSTTTLAIAAASAIVALDYLVSLRRTVGGVGTPSLRNFLASAGHLELLVAGLVLFACFPLAAFPQNPVGPGTVVNIYTHLLGYGLGYMAPFVTFGLIVVDEGRTSQ